MQLISIDCQSITPPILREVADIYETTGVEHHKAPIKYNINQSPKDILDEHYEDIENDADDARSELDDVVIWLQGLPDLIKQAIKEIETANPTLNISAFFDDSLEYITLISKHAIDARNAVVTINTCIDPEYQYTKLPDYTTIT